MCQKTQIQCSSQLEAVFQILWGHKYTFHIAFKFTFYIERNKTTDKIWAFSEAQIIRRVNAFSSARNKKFHEGNVNPNPNGVHQQQKFLRHTEKSYRQHQSLRFCYKNEHGDSSDDEQKCALEHYIESIKHNMRKIADKIRQCAANCLNILCYVCHFYIQCFSCQILTSKPINL